MFDSMIIVTVISMIFFGILSKMSYYGKVLDEQDVYTIFAVLMGYTSFTHIIWFLFLWIIKDVMLFPSFYHLILLLLIPWVYKLFYKFDRNWIRVIIDISDYSKPSSWIALPGIATVVILFIALIYDYLDVHLLNNQIENIIYYMCMFGFIQMLMSYLSVKNNS